MDQFQSNGHARSGHVRAIGALGAGDPVRAGTARRQSKSVPYVHMKTFFRIEPCTPQLASTTWVTPKSAATDISAIASSSLM
jgi:hypothetical protein